MNAPSQRGGPDRAGRLAGGAVDVAVATIGADHFGDENFRYALEVLPVLPVRNVELMCWYPRTITPQGMRSAVARFRSRGLRPVSVHYPAFRTWSANHLSATVAYMLWMLHAVRTEGIQILKFTGPARSLEGGLAGVVEALVHVIPVAEELGVSVVLENHFGNAIEFTTDYLEIFSQIDSPNLGVCLDMGHCAASGVDMVDLIDRLPGRIFHIDVKDCRAVGAPDFVRYGEGIVEFERVLGHAVRAGFGGYLVVELSRLSTETMREDLEAGCRIAARYAGLGLTEERGQ